MPSGAGSGAPSVGIGGGAGGGGGTGRRVSVSTQRTTFIGWYEARVGPQRTVTPEDGEAVKELTPLEHVQACLRMDEALAEGDKRPTLVYFHWPHEHAVHGEATTQLCSKVLDDEVTARWGTLFRCVQVDMAASDARLIELLGQVDRPSIFVLDAETKVVAKIQGLTSPTKMQKALREAYQRFPESWKRVQREIADQEKLLVEAKGLAKDDDYAGALTLVDKIRRSNVRVGEPYEESLFLGYDLQQRKDQAEAKERENKR